MWKSSNRLGSPLPIAQGTAGRSVFPRSKVYKWIGCTALAWEDRVALPVERRRTGAARRVREVHPWGSGTHLCFLHSLVTEEHASLRVRGLLNNIQHPAGAMVSALRGLQGWEKQAVGVVFLFHRHVDSWACGTWEDHTEFCSGVQKQQTSGLSLLLLVWFEEQGKTFWSCSMLLSPTCGSTGETAFMANARTMASVTSLLWNAEIPGPWGGKRSRASGKPWFKGIEQRGLFVLRTDKYLGNVVY